MIIDLERLEKMFNGTFAELLEGNNSKVLKMYKGFGEVNEYINEMNPPYKDPILIKYENANIIFAISNNDEGTIFPVYSFKLDKWFIEVVYPNTFKDMKIYELSDYFHNMVNLIAKIYNNLSDEEVKSLKLVGLKYLLNNFNSMNTEQVAVFYGTVILKDDSMIKIIKDTLEDKETFKILRNADWNQYMNILQRVEVFRNE